MLSFSFGSRFIPTEAFTPNPKRVSSITMVNFLMSFFFIRRFIRLYSTDALMFSFFDRFGTEIEPSFVNSKSNFMSSSSKRCNACQNLFLTLINVGFFYKKKSKTGKILVELSDFLKITVHFQTATSKRF